jgi:RES domain-containing protein
VLVWRIGSIRYADQAFSGEGARLYGGRWNHRGTRVVYTSATLSLAALELFVHLDTDLIPEHLVAVSAEIPSDLRVDELQSGDLPAAWRSYPAPERLQDLGTRWLLEERTAVLSVPSAVVPSERNFLLNPAHRDFARILTHEPRPFRFDPRMWKPVQPTG